MFNNFDLVFIISGQSIHTSFINFILFDNISTSYQQIKLFCKKRHKKENGGPLIKQPEERTRKESCVSGIVKTEVLLVWL